MHCKMHLSTMNLKKQITTVVMIFDPKNEIIDCFKDTAIKIDEFKKPFLVRQETDCIDSFSYLICYAIRYQKANKKQNVKMI